MEIAPLSLRAPADVLAAIPYLLGFVPADSVVVLGLKAKKITFQVRVDLPAPGDVREFARSVAPIVARQRVTRALVVGYGVEATVKPAVLAMRTELRRRRIDVPEALRVTDGKYWSYACTNPACCDPAGMPFDATASAVACSATVAGMTALPSREDLAARLAPVGGPEAIAMRAASMRADMRLCEVIDSRSAEASVEALVAAGRAAVDMATLRFTYGGMLDDDDVAWLGLLLVNLAVRDYAWERVGDDLTVNIKMWTYVLRRVDPDLVAAPATLLAFAAWRGGEGAVASIALERATEADPHYGMARLLGAAFNGGLSPTEYVELMEADAATAAEEQVSPRSSRVRGRVRPARRTARNRVA
jgi:hypothetical protein